MLEVGNASAIESQIRSGSCQPVGKKRKITSDQDEDTIPEDTIPVDDDAESMRLMFNLLENQKEPVKLEDHPVARLKNLVTLADKYDLALVTRLLMQVLWDGIEKSDKSAFKVYQVAVALKLGALARYAVYRFGKTERPEKFSWAVIQELGLEAYSSRAKVLRHARAEQLIYKGLQNSHLTQLDKYTCGYSRILDLRSCISYLPYPSFKTELSHP